MLLMRPVMSRGHADLFSAKNTHLHQAELGAGASLTRDGLGGSCAAVFVVRHDLQEERLERDNGWKPKVDDERGEGSGR